MRITATYIVTLTALYSSNVFSCTQSKDPETVVQAQVEAYNAHDIELFASCYSSDIKMQHLTGDIAQTVGKKELVKAFQFLKTVPKGFKVTIENRVVNGPTVIDYERIEGLGEGREDTLVVVIYEVRNGKIKNVWFPPAN
ncbi:nuclear transport factor 2 family protein [Pseudoalteromonas undina]|uniref:nuclear transport factor 2 family protein n=1 Tax=Pseudoalteromonas undina TaxID=43660 RepID=UPI001D02264A|nr:nuclear transport factor 2 family protein [Pseudoalteromonas undina]